MTWIKEANKIGRYTGTYYGFRLYCTLEPFSTEKIVDRDGEQWRETTFHPGWYIAINRHDEGFEGNSRSEVIFKCQWSLLENSY